MNCESTGNNNKNSGSFFTDSQPQHLAACTLGNTAHCYVRFIMCFIMAEKRRRKKKH